MLIGDGWVKDGDFNTTHAKTVGAAARRTTSPSTTPTCRPCSRTIRCTGGTRDDWLNWHTRYVAPDYFLRGLRRVEREPETPGGGKP